MKIRKDVFLEKLEEYGYQYKENLFFPTYQKIRTFGNKTIIIEIFIHNRQIFIAKSSHITEKNKRFIQDLIDNHWIEKEKV